MPFIDVKLSVATTDEKNLQLKTALGKAISLLPGKSEGHLMVGIESEIPMYFHGDDGKIAFVEVKILGSSTRQAYTALTAEICRILEELYSISGCDVYVKFEEIENWGNDSRLF